MNCAPIALFTYNRLSHARQTVEALLRNPQARESALFIFSDAAKHEADMRAVGEVRHYLRQISGFSSVQITERRENYGLARSIIDGVSAMCDRHGRVIVLEDDIVTSPYFLQYMNDGLDLYQDIEKVISIHGYQFPVDADLPETFFLKGAECWGWATWKRGWDLFEPDGRVLLRELEERELTYSFDLDGAYPYTEMLRNQIRGKNSSWAVRWRASAFLKDKLTLHPKRSLVLNIGMDSSGTHCSTTEEFSGYVMDSPVVVEPIPIEENSFARQQTAAFLKASSPVILIRILRKLAKIAKGFSKL